MREEQAEDIEDSYVISWHPAVEDIEEEGEGEGENENGNPMFSDEYEDTDDDATGIMNEYTYDDTGDDISVDYDESLSDAITNDEYEDSPATNTYEYSVNLNDPTVVDHYGTFGWIIHRNLMKSKIYDSKNGQHFIPQMIEYLLLHIKQEGKVASVTALAKLLSCIPSLEKLKRVVTKTTYTPKEAIIIKVILEIYDIYHRHYESPTFTIYMNEVLPLLVAFHDNLGEVSMRTVNSQVRKILTNVKNYGNEFTLLKSKEEYNTHYRNITRRIRNLCEANDTPFYFR